MAAAIASNGNCKCRRHVLYRPCSICDRFSCRTRSCYLFGVSNQWFSIEHIPDFGILPAVQISILAVLCALVSIVFCVLLHKSEEIYRKLFQNPLHPHLCRWMYCCHSDDACRQPELQRYRYGIIQMCIDGTISPENLPVKDDLYRTDSLVPVTKAEKLFLPFHRRGLWLPVWNADRHIPRHFVRLSA